VPLAIKPHPELPRPDWIDPFAMRPNVRIADSEPDVSRLLRRAACVVAQSSSMLYQASVLGRPVIVARYDPAPLGFYVPEVDRPHVIVRTRKELRRAIEAVVDGRGRALTRDEIAPFHPRSTERVIAVLERLAG
jgi:CDP-glycerol glycerophosphotransferase (TagB/SpsB family)